MCIIVSMVHHEYSYIRGKEAFNKISKMKRCLNLPGMPVAILMNGFESIYNIYMCESEIRYKI